MMEMTLNEIQETMDWLASISDGEGPGTTRLLYSPSWLTAQTKLKERFEALGMRCHFDAIGNLYGTLEGSEMPEKTIATGSHVDTVVRGGKLDGQLGIFGGYLAVKKLLEVYGKPKKSIQIISMAEEEGSRFPYVFWGSKNIFGLAKKEDVAAIKDADGIGFVEAMQKAGFDFSEAHQERTDIEAFIELHIEQGNFLEEEQFTVGVVNSIVGQKRYNITLKGEANHAGTTLMRYRKDTVECMARIITQSIDKAKAAGDPLVLTFGKVVPSPNTVNVVPGETLFTMDCRHTDAAFLQEFTLGLENDMRKIAERYGISIEIDNWMNEKPVLMDAKVVETIENVCRSKNLNYKLMHSGAGHDSQIFAPRVPTGMIFVPSIKGISHNPAEDTKVEDLREGIRALAYTLHEFAY
ncbi:allantoate deiminase [Azotosporobacter soli]|uniref:allantoate deiminase n=1 Tax=Azotosporobacter soli TaxID=3055040 RepID=UPI0031FE445A